jgi:5-methyltetrahydropteroyltriglutamate--homocysteine methyltransferase
MLSNQGVLATCLGHPRIGAQRELKRALEAYWSGRSSRDALEATGRDLRQRHWLTMRAAGLDHIPSNDFSFYDHVLDAAIATGVVPPRYQAVPDPLARMFAMARGLQDRATGADLPALEMTKWFDTNYHYLVPELAPDQVFQLDPRKILGEVAEARTLGIAVRPVLLGPVTLLRLSKTTAGAPASTSIGVLDRLVGAYEELLATLAGEGVDWVQLDEPALALDLDGPTREAYRRALERLSFLKKRPRLMLTTYFEGIADNLDVAVQSGCEAIHVDLVRAPEQLEAVLAALPPKTILSAGVVDGRNVWRADLDAAHARVRRAVRALGPERVWVAPSCSLLHVPVDVAGEEGLDPQLKSWLAFARQKLDEIRALADAAGEDAPDAAAFATSRAVREGRRASERVRNAAVRSRVRAVADGMLRRRSPYPQRAPQQRARFSLPLLPTTTIGSFPQTADVRAARAAWRARRLMDADYVRFLKEETARCIAKQEELGLDVLVHGEFERTDMVEYFGEQLEGFAFTQNGWVQSYGSRCVKPPVLYGDVARPRPMTVDWSRYAQSLTARPVKGMLTGPVTILQWSFVRDDEPRAAVCAQVALALRDEVADLEAAGIGMIQVDEPAIREGLPLRRGNWANYLRWAVDGFRLASAGVRDETQIHTHMCYADFGDILPAVAAMDADVLSIETSRSRMELLEDFGRFAYPNEVGPGVYDIHSPRVPSADEMAQLLRRAATVLPPERLWVNPDCGLKTRGWPEVEAALRNLVEAARHLRQDHQKLASSTTSPVTPT